jgi:ketosteroid isomerase-like protein
VYGRVVEPLVRSGFERLNRRDVTGLLERYADDAHFVFQGDHALAADVHSKQEIAEWFERLFARVPDMKWEVHEVLVSGPPWRLGICTRYTAGGNGLVLRNMQFARIERGKVTEELIYPDTLALARFLDAHAP